jgi:hypothetical protein
MYLAEVYVNFPLQLYLYVCMYLYIYLQKIYLGIGNDADNDIDGSYNLSAILKRIYAIKKI